MKHFIIITTLLLPLICHATGYHVGPGQTYLNIGDVPLEQLLAGDTIYVHHRSTPYQEKLLLTGAGQSGVPIVLHGVKSSSGQRPVISGSNATTRQQLDYWNEARGIIKIGGSSSPGTYPTHIVIEHLDIRSARPGYFFTDDAGNTQEYSSNAAAVFLEEGAHITIQDCHISDCGNGIFSASATSEVTIANCHIYDNGIEGSFLEHNTYTESNGIVYHANRFGLLRPNCLGNNLKDRSAGTVIRYNWIEGGNRQLDLVDAGHSNLINDPKYRNTYVYNNVLIEHPDQGNRQIVHYGGDSGNTANYRKGTLYFYHNTVISYVTNRTTLFRLSTGDEFADTRNNIIYAAGGGANLQIRDSDGSVDLQHCWLNTGWVDSYNPGTGQLQDLGGHITGIAPDLGDIDSMNYAPNRSADIIGAATSPHDSIPTSHIPELAYYGAEGLLDQRKALDDIGAYAFPRAIVMLDSEPDSAGILNGGGLYPVGDTIEVTAMAAMSYTFEHWADNQNNVISSDTSLQIILSSDTSLTAVFDLLNSAHIVTSNTDINIYPNPFTDKVVIDGLLTAYEVIIFDDMGTVVQNLTGLSGPQTIDLDALGSGTFFISLLNLNNQLLYVHKNIKY